DELDIGQLRHVLYDPLHAQLGNAVQGVASRTKGVDDVHGDGRAFWPVRPGRGHGVEDQTVNLVWRHAGVGNCSAECQDAPGAHTGLGCAVPAPSRWRVSDPDGRDLAAMFPQSQALSGAIEGCGRILRGHYVVFSPRVFSGLRPPAPNWHGICGAQHLADDLPLGDLLAVGRRLEYHFDTGSHGDLIHRRSREVGVHLDTRVLVQHNHRDVERLVLLQQPDRTIVHHAVVVDRAPSTHLLPRQMVLGATLLTRRRRWMLQLVAG